LLTCLGRLAICPTPLLFRDAIGGLVAHDLALIPIRECEAKVL
jgi:hypothetical protein